MDTPQTIPLRAVPLSVAALAVPVTGAVFVPSWLQEDTGLLLWLTPILPAFLLAYYRGWVGAALALAWGMASLAVANVVLMLTDRLPPEPALMMVLVVVYIVAANGVAALAESMERRRRVTEHLAFTDALTGLPNRRHAADVLRRGFDAARRGDDLSVVLFDLDRFKAVNDAHGHAVGDMVLRALGRVLMETTRGSDLAARFGGEEFLAVLPGSGGDAAWAFAERVREELQRADVPVGRVTVSAGVATYAPDMATPEELLSAADQALYAAKQGGRDRVVVHEFLPLEPTSPMGGWEDASPPLRVLVVDDDAVVERTVARSLRRLGFDASPAGGSQAALRRLSRADGTVDVLLTDVVMPDLSGPRLVECLSRRGACPRVVYMSGYPPVELEAHLGGERAAHFVEKPMDLASLAAVLRRWSPQAGERSFA